MSLVRPADRIRARASKARAPRCPWVAAGGRGRPSDPESEQTLAAPAARSVEAGDADEPRATGTKAYEGGA